MKIYNQIHACCTNGNTVSFAWDLMMQKGRLGKRVFSVGLILLLLAGSFWQSPTMIVNAAGSSSISFTTEGDYTQEDAANGTDFSSGVVKLHNDPASLTYPYGTLGAWSFDNGNNTTTSGSLTLNTSGSISYSNGAANLNDGYFLTPSRVFNTADPWTVEVWWKNTGGGEPGMCEVGYHKDGMGSGGGLYAHYNKDFYTWFNTHQGQYNNSLGTNQWYHVVMTYNGTGTVRGYLNGAYQVTSPVSFDANYDGIVRFGMVHSANGSIDNNFILNGVIDEATVYNRVISDSEISNHYTAGKPYGGSYPTSQSYYVATTNASRVDSSTWTGITGVSATQTTPANTNIRYAVSFDGRNSWKTWNGSNWQSISLDNLATSGMTKTTLEGLNQSHWSKSGGFIPGSTTTIDLAAGLASTEASLTPELDQITFNYATDSSPNISSITPDYGVPAGGDTVTISGSNFQGKVSCDANTKSFWKLDEPTGTSFSDLCGTNTATANGTTSVTGKYGNARSFNGSSYIGVASPQNIPTGNTITAEAWVKPSGTYADGTFNGILSWGNRTCSGNSFVLAVQNSGRLSFSTWCNDYVPSTGTTLTANQWNHVAAVLNGNAIKLYVNGSVASSGTLSGTPSVVSNAVRIGSTDLTGRYFNGQIDEVRVSNVARSDAEILAAYNSGYGNLTFGGTKATSFQVQNTTTVSATVPAHTTGAVDVVYTNPDGQISTLFDGFSYLAVPTITSITPDEGSVSGGTSVTITGTNLFPGTTVQFGSTNATSVSYINGTTLTATVPAAGSPGGVDVVVTNPDSNSATLTGGYTYTNPLMVTGVSDNGTYYGIATPVFSGGNGAISATLNGQPYTSGTPINTNGSYSLMVEDSVETLTLDFDVIASVTLTDPTPTKIQDDILQGYLSYTGTAATTANSATFNPGYTLQSSGMQVSAPYNTTVTKVGGGTFDFTAFDVENITTEIQAGGMTGIQGALRIGTGADRFTFSVPITVRITVGESNNGQTFLVQYRNAGESEWQDEGNCTVSGGICEFTTTHATDFAAGPGPLTVDEDAQINLDLEATLSLACTDTVIMGTITGYGKSNLASNTATCNVRTNNSGGYKLEWQASSDDMASTNPDADTFAAYTPVGLDTPEAWSVATTEAAWGARLSDVSTTDNTSAWGVDDQSGTTYGTTARWLNVRAASPFQIVHRITETDNAGDNEVILFGAEIGSSKI